MQPYAPAQRLAEGPNDPAFRTKPQIALDLVDKAQALGLPYRVVVADSFCEDNTTFWEALDAARLHTKRPLC